MNVHVLVQPVQPCHGVLTYVRGVSMCKGVGGGMHTCVCKCKCKCKCKYFTTLTTIWIST